MIKNVAKLAGFITAGVLAVGLGGTGYAEKEIRTIRIGSDASSPTENVRIHKLQNFASGGSFLGVHLEEITKETFGELGLSEERGAHLTEIVEGSPAEAAGLQKGDVVLSWNGTRVESAAQLQRFVRETPIGRTVRLGVSRADQMIDVPVEIGERKLGNGFSFFSGDDASGNLLLHEDGDLHAFGELAELKLDHLGELSAEERLRLEESLSIAKGALRDVDDDLKVFSYSFDFDSDVMEDELAQSLKHFELKATDGNGFTWFDSQTVGRGMVGVQLQSLTDQLAEFFGVDGQSTALVASVVKGSPAEEAGLKAGDVIVAVEGNNTEDVSKAIHAIRENYEKDQILFTIIRDRHPMSVTVDLPETVDEEK